MEGIKRQTHNSLELPMQIIVPNSNNKKYVEEPSSSFAKGSSQSQLPEVNVQKKTERHWSYILKLFKQIENVPSSSVNIIKPLRTSRTSNCWRKQSSQRSILNSTKRETFNIKNIGICKKNLKLQRSKRKNEKNCDKENFSKFQTGWSANDESNDCKGNAKNISLANLSKQHECAEEIEIVWSSSESGDSNDETSVHKSNVCKPGSAECELNLFIAEIEKDMQRTNRKKRKLHIKKKDSLLEESRVAIQRGKSDRTFLRYEEQAGILKGLSAVIMEVKPSYGVCAVNVKMETGNQCCFLLAGCTQSVKVGSSLICFADYSKKYAINGLDVFIQPNKIVES